MKWPHTSSFIAGLGTGAGTTALMAHQPDWWLWLLAGIASTIYAATVSVIDERRNRKNVTLIAAAPDLYEACEIIMDAVSRTSIPAGQIPHIAHAVQFVQMALKKAKGDK